jgi:hypothetical protein
MKMAMKRLAASGLAAAFLAAGTPPGFHAVAFINDNLSHGTLGDAFLSLNEAIQLRNGQLQLAQLSAAEQQQISLIPGTGSSLAVTWIDIDAANTPVITIEQDLTPMLDTPFGVLLKGFGGSIVLDFSGPNLTRGLDALANTVSVQDITFLGGPYGLDIVQTDVSGQAGATLTNVRFEGQTQFGLRVRSVTTHGVGRCIVDQCRFENCPTAIQFDESASGRTSIFEAHAVDIVGAQIGCDAKLGPGGSTRYTFDRVEIDASVRGIRIERPVGANRSNYVETQFLRVRSPECLRIDCHPTGLTWALLWMLDLRSSPGGVALQLGAAGDGVFGEVGDGNLDGGMVIGAGNGPQPLSLRNLRCKNGAVTLHGSATQNVALRECRFDACALTSSGGPIAVADSCFVGSSMVGSAQAPWQLTNSHGGAGTNVQNTAPLPAPQLGSIVLAPEDVAVGGSITFQVDLPPGLLSVFAFGFTPTTLVVPSPLLPIWFGSQPFALLPGVYQLQQGFTWNVPANPGFVGTDLLVQAAVLPGAGMQAPALQLPPGRRFVLR